MQGVGKEQKIYTRRFSEHEEQVRRNTWKVLVQDFFQPYVSAHATVVDIGAGDGLFITNIRAHRRIAVDLSPHVRALAAHGVEVIEAEASAFRKFLDEPVDVIFMSNFLEHLPDKRILLEVLQECHHALRPGGTLLILQPNIRYTGAAYWDYIDHHIALTEHSLQEALEVSGFRVTELIPRFLPYTSKSLLGQLLRGASATLFTRLYLKLPALWNILGQQTFVVATPV